MIRSKRYTAAALLIGSMVCAVDAASKVLAVAGLTAHRQVVLLGGLLTLRLHRNPGAAFSFGPSYTAIYALIAADGQRAACFGPALPLASRQGPPRQ